LKTAIPELRKKRIMEKVPAEEIHQRLTKFQADLTTHNLDGALLFQNVDIS